MKRRWERERRKWKRWESPRLPINNFWLLTFQFFFQSHSTECSNHQIINLHANLSSEFHLEWNWISIISFIWCCQFALNCSTRSQLQRHPHLFSFNELYNVGMRSEANPWVMFIFLMPLSKNTRLNSVECGKCSNRVYHINRIRISGIQRNSRNFFI